MIKTICIVEDTPELLDNLSLFLTFEGYKILECRNGVEATEMLRTHTPDLIITDLWMPGKNGFELIDSISEMTHLANVPIAVFSAAPLTTEEQSKLKRNIAGFIKKPIAMDDLVKLIVKFLK